jgi:hypothetical protein
MPSKSGTKHHFHTISESVHRKFKSLVVANGRSKVAKELEISTSCVGKIIANGKPPPLIPRTIEKVVSYVTRNGDSYSNIQSENAAQLLSISIPLRVVDDEMSAVIEIITTLRKLSPVSRDKAMQAVNVFLDRK